MAVLGSLLWLAKQSFPFTFRARPADHIAGSFGADWPNSAHFFISLCFLLATSTFYLWASF